MRSFLALLLPMCITVFASNNLLGAGEEAATATVAASSFTIDFASGTPSTYALDSGVDIQLDTTGTMASPVIVSAWDRTNLRIITEFTTVYRGGPWVIPASKMNLLPVGDVVITLEPIGGTKVSKRFTIQAPVAFKVDFAPSTETTQTLGAATAVELVTEGTLASGDAVIISAWDKAKSAIVSEFTMSLTAAPWTIPATQMNKLPEGEIVVTVGTVKGDKVSKVFNIVADQTFSLAFAADTPSAITLGAAPAVELVAKGKPAADQIVVISAWDKSALKIVTDFTFVLKAAPWTIPASQMNKLPAGNVVVTVEPLGGEKVSKLFTIAEAASDPGTDPEPTPEEPAEETPVDPQPIGTGFTDWKTSSDSKVVFVPSGGSIKNGYDQLRDGYPDHLVLEAGGSYSIGSGLKWAKSGRSASEPMVMRVVGDGDRPVIHATGSAISFSGTVKYTAFVGLHLTADTRNPSHSSYSSSCARYDGFSLYQPAVNLTIEDCLVEYFTHGILLEGANDVNVKIHRSIIRHSWSQSSKGHSQGLYALRATNLTITDSVFDQNGWEPRASGGGRTIFNHNIYVIGTKTLTVDNCIFSRGSSYGINLRTGTYSNEDQTNVTVANSVFVDNANTIAAGGKVKEVVSKNLKIADCVFTRHGAVINSTPQSLGINGYCWDGIEVARNYFIDKSFGGTSFAVKFEPGKGPVRNGKIYGNVVQSWYSSETAIQPSGSNMSAYGNFVDQSLSIYANAPRTIDSYMNSVSKSGSTTGYIDWAASRDRATWDPRPFDFTDYIAAGYKAKF